MNNQSLIAFATAFRWKPFVNVRPNELPDIFLIEGVLSVKYDDLFAQLII